MSQCHLARPAQTLPLARAADAQAFHPQQPDAVPQDPASGIGKCLCPPPPKRDSRGSFCTALWVALIKGPIFSTNLAFLAESTDAPICVFGLGHQSKDWLKKVMHVRAFLLLGSGPGRGGRREVGWFVFKQLFILLPLNFWSEEVFLPPPPSFRVFLCIALLFGFPLFSDSRKKFY